MRSDADETFCFRSSLLAMGQKTQHGEACIGAPSACKGGRPSVQLWSRGCEYGCNYTPFGSIVHGDLHLNIFYF